MIAVVMPVFQWTDFADTSLAWLSEHPLALLFTLVGFLACGFVLLLWHDTRDDARGEMNDTAPKVQKVVQIKDGVKTYTAEDYRELVRRYQSDAEHAAGAERRILDKWEADRAEMARKWADRPKKERA